MVFHWLFWSKISVFVGKGMGSYFAEIFDAGLTLLYLKARFQRRSWEQGFIMVMKLALQSAGVCMRLGSNKNVRSQLERAQGWRWSVVPAADNSASDRISFFEQVLALPNTTIILSRLGRPYYLCFNLNCALASHLRVIYAAQTFLSGPDIVNRCLDKSQVTNLGPSRNGAVHHNLSRTHW